MQSVMELFLLFLIFIPISLLTSFDSDSNDVSHVRCPLGPYPPISLCPATVPEMNQTAYFKLATECLDDTYTKAWYLREGGKPSEANSKEINKKDGNTSNDDRIVNPHDSCMICICAHFLSRFSKDQQRAWIRQESWAKGISDQPVTIVPSAPLAEWVLDPHTEVSTKGMPEVLDPHTKVSTIGMYAILILCGSVGLGLLIKVGQQPTPTMPPGGRPKCASCGKFTKKDGRCHCSKIPRPSKND